MEIFGRTYILSVRLADLERQVLPICSAQLDNTDRLQFISLTLFNMVNASGSRINMLALSVPSTRQEIASSSE